MADEPEAEQHRGRDQRGDDLVLRQGREELAHGQAGHAQQHEPDVAGEDRQRLRVAEQVERDGSINVPAVISRSMVIAPKYLPSTICQGSSGSASSSSIVRALYSAENNRIEITGISVSRRTPMF